MQHLKASEQPQQHISAISYPGQPDNMKIYYGGHESIFNKMPVIGSENKDYALPMIKSAMKEWSESVKADPGIMNENLPEDGQFKRVILALEPPTIGEGGELKEGSEVVVAKWGDGFTSPVHGHAAGYMHEEILSGKMRVNTYRITDPENRIVRPYLTTIQNEGVFVSDFAEETLHPRQTLVHNFTAVGPTLSLHFLPEHTRDGRDNGFTVEHFTDSNPLTEENVTRIDSFEGMYLQKGDVVLVRSTNVPEYGDHYIVVVGPPVMKEHGFRIQDKSIIASEKDTKFLDKFTLRTGLTLLKLNKETKEKFLEFHGISIENNEVIFPQI